MPFDSATCSKRFSIMDRPLWASARLRFIDQTGEYSTGGIGEYSSGGDKTNCCISGTSQHQHYVSEQYCS
jgi:hypothetical protein